MLSSYMSKSIDSLDVGSMVSNGHLSVCEHLSPDSSPTLSRLNQVPDIIQIVGRNSRNGNGTEDKYAFLLDQKDDHIPLHKTIHCAMCKNKEDRKLKAMQDSSVFETSHSVHALRSQRLYRHQHSLGNLLSLPPCMESDVPMSQTEQEQYPTEHKALNSHPESIESSETDLCNGNGHIRAETEDALDSVTPKENLNSNSTAKFNGHNQPETENALESNKLNGILNSKSTVKFNGETNQTAETKARPLSDDEGTKSPESDCVENGGNVGLFRRSQSFRVTKDPAKTDRRGAGDPLRRHKPQEYSRDSFPLDTLSPKDQKMISVLLAKKEKEQEENRLRESNHLRWEEERISSKNKKMADSYNSKSQDRTKDKSIKTEHERESRDVVFRRQKTADGVSSSKQRPHSEYFCSGRNVDGTCSCGRDHNKPMKLTTLNKRLTSSETGCNHKDSNDCLAECCSRYASSTGLMKADRKQEKAKAQLQQAIDRKKLVEERLEEQQRKTDNYLRELKEKQELELERASMSKRDKHEQVKQKVMQHNETARQKFEQIKESQKQILQDKSSTHESIDANLTAAEMKARRKREEESARTKAELQSKIEKSQRKQQQMEEELKAWHEQILTYRQQQAKHAEELFQAQLAKKREAASKVRESKERQQGNMQRMLEMEKEWKASVEASIHSKEARSKMLQQEKEAMIQKSRAQAQMTRRMREDLRLNYSMNDLDRLSKQVLLQSKVFSP